MNKRSLSSFEDDVRAATQMTGPRTEFVEALWGRMPVHGPRTQSLAAGQRQGPARRRLWVVLGVVVAALVAAALFVGPERVYAALRQFFGYIPGVGIVNETEPIRVLAEPVSSTRGGITVTVTSAILTADRTHIEYRIFGVPRAAYPDREDVAGCLQPEYLRLPDGTRLARSADMPPVPGNVNQAVFVLPCIPETLPGAAPENWELPLRFVPAPTNLTVMPVLELSPSPEPTGEGSETPSATQEPGLQIDQVIETSDGYILAGEFLPEAQPGVWLQTTSPIAIRDRAGKDVAYSIPQDIQPPSGNNSSSEFGFVVQFKAAGLAFPITLSWSGVDISRIDPNAKAEFEFDAGSDPQPGQEWTPNQDVQLAGHILKLVSISADLRGGYSFKFEADPQVVGAGVAIAGYTPNGGGGGGGGGLTNGVFFADVSYPRIPTGRLTVTVSDLQAITGSFSWHGQWSPPTPKTNWPAAPTPAPGVCLSSDSLGKLKPAPSDLTGKALFFEPLDSSGKWGIVLYNLDGSQKRVLVPDGSWGALSPDGSQIAYPATGGIHILDLATSQERVLKDPHGAFDLHWSPDGRQIAFIGGDADSAFIIPTDGTPARQASGQSYESIIGWSPDGARLYLDVPYTGGSAWKVIEVDASSGASRDLFDLENASRKAPGADLSPDAAWIAYRDSENSSLYLIRTDGSENRLVLDKPAAAITGILWSPNGRWLGVSLGNSNTEDRTVVLLQPEGCQAYLLPALHGDLEGLYLP